MSDYSSSSYRSAASPETSFKTWNVHTPAAAGQSSGALAASALASLSDHLAVLDRNGTILAVNDAWNAYGISHGVQDVAAIGRTVNYLDICARAARTRVPHADSAHDGIKAVCLGHRPAFELEYPCNGPSESSWFLMTVTPFHHKDGGAVVSHRNITEWREACAPRERALSRLAGIQLRNLRCRLVTAQEDERRRIARELHDDVNQRLALLAIGIEQTSLLTQDPIIGARLHDLWVETTGISTSVHNLSHAMHSFTLALGLVSAIRSLSRDLFAKGLHIAVVAGDARIEMAQASALCLFRVAQEALNNVLKHSGTCEATVTLRETERSVHLSVEDRGRGFDPLAQHAGLGLVSMRERVAFVGGELLIRARPGGGTSIHARVSRDGVRAAASELTPQFAA